MRKLILIFAMIAAVAVTPLTAAPAQAEPADKTSVTVGHLTTENTEKPLGIGVARPRLSWQLSSPDRGQTQTAYEILVASSPAALAESQGDVWDSGKVTSTQSANIAYAGPALASSTRYYWQVRVWDSQDLVSEWSSSQWWEMGLLNPSDWTADWVGPPAQNLAPDLTGSNWIWNPEYPVAGTCNACTMYFRMDFTVPAGRTISSATLTSTADNQVTGYVNGNQVLASTDWTKAGQQDVTSALVPGANVVALAAYNVNGGDGVIGRLRINFTSGDPMIIDTDATTKTNSSLVTGWQTTSFDDSAWKTALVMGAYGIAPWKTNVTVAPPAMVHAPLLRKEFTAPSAIKSARAYVVGLGNYTLNINGKKVGDRLLDPAYTVFEKTDLYATYDVTADLRLGTNAIGVELAPGFYYYNTPKLLMQLVITYANGTTATIVSDKSWQLDNSGPTSFAASGGASGQPVFGGESYDARLYPAGWDKPGFAATGWGQANDLPAPGGKLVAETQPPITSTGAVIPTNVTKLPSGSYVLDMGQMMTGWATLTAAGKPGETVTLQYGEKLNANGTVNATAVPGPRNRWMRDDYTFATDGTESWTPSYTFKSFRYIQVIGLDAAPTATTVVAHLVHTAVEHTGTFTSSDSLYNQIHTAMQRASLNGLLGYPAIDPANERNGWTADQHLAAPSEMDNFGMNAFLSEWINDIQDGQRADGSISVIDPIRDNCCFGWAPEWDAAYPLVSWDLYERAGNTNVLTSHYDSLKAYLQWQLSGVKDGISNPGSYGDWDAPGYGTAPEDRRLSATAYMYQQTEIMAKIADVVGNSADAASFRATAETIKTAFNALFLNTTTGHYQTATDPSYRQASNAIPLEFGMVPDQYKASVVQSLVDDVNARGGHLNTGILGTPALLDVLTNNGHADLAQKIVDQTDYPSWGQWLANGADTMLESWGLGSRSLNMPMFGTVDAWFYEDVAGIMPDTAHPGYQNSIIKPHPMAAPSNASASLETNYGKVASSWTATTTAFNLNVTVPANATATVNVPLTDCTVVTEGGQPAAQVPGIKSLGNADGYAQFQVGSGSYQFRCGTAPVNATLTADITAPTNTDVTVTISYPADAAVKEYKVGESGTWTAYTTPVVVSDNDTVYARGTDEAGNVSNVTSYAVSNIDKTAPAGATLTADITDPTNTDVTVTISYPADVAVMEYKVGDNGSWKAYGAPVFVSENNTVYARGTDAAGNVSDETSVTISNIDHIAPIDATLAVDTTAPTNQGVTVIINYPADASLMEYKVGASGEWTAYTTPVVVSDNDTVYARGTDAVGNVSNVTSTTVSNIYKIAPVTTATLSPDAPNGKNIWYTTDVTVSLSVSASVYGGSVTTEYKVNDDGEWIVYTGSIPAFGDGTYTLGYRSKDQAGNVEDLKTVEFKVDKTAPVLTVQLDKTSIWPANHKMVSINATLNPSDATSGVEFVVLTSITSNQPDSGQSDIQANFGRATTSFSLRAEKSRVYTITYTATDKAGNKTVTSATVTVPHDQSDN